MTAPATNTLPSTANCGLLFETCRACAEQSVRRVRLPAARVRQGEAARPVGIFGEPRAKAGLSGERRLLVAGNAADGNSGSRQCRIR